MLKTIDRKLPLKAVIWLFPLVFIIHDGEELIVMESWMKDHQGGLLSRLAFDDRIFAALSWTTPRFAVAMTVLLALICWASYSAAPSLKPSKAVNWFVGGITVLFLNVFTHSAQSILIGGYSPGVITALVVGLPYALYTFYRMLSAGWITRRYINVVVSVSLLILITSIVISIFDK